MEFFSDDNIVKILTKRGKQKVLYQGFGYTLKRSYETKDVWVCRHSSCHSHLHLSKNDVVLKISLHNHLPDYVKIRVEYGLHCIKSRASDTNENARHIIHNATNTFNDVELFTVPKFKSITDTIKRLRNRKHKIFFPFRSDIPVSIRNTSLGEVFLQYDSVINDDNRIVVFCTEENFLHLKKKQNDSYGWDI